MKMILNKFRKVFHFPKNFPSKIIRHHHFTSWLNSVRPENVILKMMIQ